MTRISLLVTAIILASGCATDSSRYNIDYKSLSSRLYVEDSDGKLIEPFGGRLVDVDDLGIGGEAIRLVPGSHWVRTVCPVGPDGVQWTNGQPAVQYDFEVGKAYVLRCKDGYPVISPRG